MMFEWPENRDSLQNHELWQLFRKYERLLVTTNGATDGSRIAWATMCEAVARLLK